MRQYIKEYPAISEESYTFIDGGYLRSKFYERMEKAFGPDDIPDLNLDTLTRPLGAIRIFFYDSQKDDGQTLPLSKQEWINRQLETVRRTDTYRQGERCGLSPCAGPPSPVHLPTRQHSRSPARRVPTMPPAQVWKGERWKV